MRMLLMSILVLVGACSGSSKSGDSTQDGGGGTKLTGDEMNEFVAAHNKARGRVVPAASPSLPDLTWNDDAAAVAVAYAKKCTFAHNAARGNYGENLFANSGQSLTPTDVVEGWESENKDYNYADNSCTSGKQCGHYTQVVWRNTTSVGCAVQLCSTGSPFPSFPDWEIWVCDYSPPGNYVGQTPTRDANR